MTWHATGREVTQQYKRNPTPVSVRFTGSVHMCPYLEAYCCEQIVPALADGWLA